MGYLNLGATEVRSYLAIRAILASYSHQSWISPEKSNFDANVIALLFECV